MPQFRRPKAAVAVFVVLVITFLMGGFGWLGALAPSSDPSTTRSATGNSTEPDASGRGGSGATGSNGDDDSDRGVGDSSESGGVAGAPAPNDDDGARNLYAATGGAPSDDGVVVRSMAQDPLSSPYAEPASPGPPPQGGVALLGCGPFEESFLEVASTLNPTSSPSTLQRALAELDDMAAVADFTVPADVAAMRSAVVAAIDDLDAREAFATADFQGHVAATRGFIDDACGG